MIIESEIRAKLEMTTDALLIEIGHNVGLFEAPPPDHTAKRAGQRWLEERYEEFRSIVCVPSVRDALDRPSFELAVAVAEVLANVFGDVGATTVAVLLVKQGVKKMCEWK